LLHTFELGSSRHKVFSYDWMLLVIIRYVNVCSYILFLLLHWNVFMCVAVFAGKVHVPLNNQANRITNGNTAARGQFPWQVALIIDNTWFCGGSVISALWVMTAGHC
jgi:hypothetical protein